MKKKLKIFLIVSVVFSALFYVVFYSEDSFFYLLHLKQSEQDLKQDVHKAEMEIQHLMKEIQNIKSDTFFIEKIARDELNLVKQGELVIIFNDKG